MQGSVISYSQYPLVDQGRKAERHQDQHDANKSKEKWTQIKDKVNEYKSHRYNSKLCISIYQFKELHLKDGFWKDKDVQSILIHFLEFINGINHLALEVAHFLFLILGPVCDVIVSDAIDV